MNCPEAIDVMEEALDGVLEPEQRSGFEDHMEECSPCRTYLEQLRVTRETLRSLPRSSPTNPHRSELIDRFSREVETDS